jgi:regulator of RNase E activity RraA
VPIGWQRVVNPGDIVVADQDGIVVIRLMKRSKSEKVAD